MLLENREKSAIWSLLQYKTLHTVAILVIIISKCLPEVTALLSQAHKHLSREFIASVCYPHERIASDLRQLGCPRYVFMVSHTPVSSFSHTAIFKRANKALYYSVEKRASKFTGTVPTCPSVCGKPEKQEQAGISMCQVRYLFLNPAPLLK